MYLELFITFLKLGLFTIGGGMAMIPLLKDEMVHKKKWLTEDEMLDCLSISQGLPGVIAVNMATYIGYRKKGPMGSLIATVGVITPSFIAIILVIEVLEQVSESPYVKGAISGIKAVATALIILAAYQVGRNALKSTLHYIMAVVTFVAVGIMSMNAVYAIIAGCAIGIAIKFIDSKDHTDMPNKDFESSKEETKKKSLDMNKRENENDYWD